MPLRKVILSNIFLTNIAWRNVVLSNVFRTNDVAPNFHPEVGLSQPRRTFAISQVTSPARRVVAVKVTVNCDRFVNVSFLS